MNESFESYISQEAKRAQFETFAKKIANEGRLFHAQKHDSNGESPKTYHNSEHPEKLQGRAERLANIFNLSPKQRLIVEMAIAWHDTIINFDPADPENLTAMIKRHRGAREGDLSKGANGNEAKSAELLESKMRKVNENAGYEVFTEEDIQTALWAIDATYPEVQFNVEFEQYPYYEEAIRQNRDLVVVFQGLKLDGITKGAFFSQPHLEKTLEEALKEGGKVPKEVLITALSDLGAAGIEEAEVFFKEGDDEMRELYANLNRPEVLHRLLNGDEDADKADREKVANAFIGWLNMQPGFVVSQTLRFEKIVSLLKNQKDISPEEELRLRSEFRHYIKNIQATRDRAKQVSATREALTSTKGEKEAFRYLAGTLRYKIPYMG